MKIKFQPSGKILHHHKSMHLAHMHKNGYLRFI